MDDRMNGVQQMQDYIRTHLNEEITLDQLAMAAHFHPGILPVSSKSIRDFHLVSISVA